LTKNSVDISKKLKQSINYNQVFELVRTSVQRTLGTRRAGLSLILAELPNNIGAYHVMGSNNIVMNKTILDLVKRQARSNEGVNSYIFTILAHEYLHSFGFTDEADVKKKVYQVCAQNLGESHQTTKVATRRFEELYPDLKYLGPGKAGNEYVLIKEFDAADTPYFG